MSSQPRGERLSALPPQAASGTKVLDEMEGEETAGWKWTRSRTLTKLPWYMRVLTGDICACLPGGAGSTEPVAAAASPPRVRDAAGWAVLAVRLEPSRPRRRTIAHGTRSWCATSPCYCTVPVYHYWGRDAQDHALVWSAAVSL